jgi:hypothetical protein
MAARRACKTKRLGLIPTCPSRLDAAGTSGFTPLVCVSLTHRTIEAKNARL